MQYQLWQLHQQYQQRHQHQGLVEHDMGGRSIQCNINLLNIIDNIINAINIGICTKFSLSMTMQYQLGQLHQRHRHPQYQQRHQHQHLHKVLVDRDMDSG